MSEPGRGFVLAYDSQTTRARTIWASHRIAIATLLLLALALAAFELRSPPDLMDNEQQRTAAAVLDTLQNHHWLIQRDEAWEITSKPPMYTWLAAVVSWPLHQPTEISITIPAMLATILLVFVLYQFTQKIFGVEVGLLSALAYALSPTAVKLMGLARCDGLFVLTITWTALAAYSAWVRGRGWTWFWLAAGFATLTKGPGGLAFGAGGLLAVFWERKSAEPLKVRGRWWIGIPLYLEMTLGWFYAATQWMGPDVFKKLIVQELLGTSVPGAKHGFKLTQLVIPEFYFVSRFLPWSFLAVIQLWRIVRQPSSNPQHRRFERFLFCWIAVGLVLLCIAPHQRGDLLMPLFPPAAILSGRELARWLSYLSPVRARRTVAQITLFFVAVVAGYFRFVTPTHPEVMQTQVMQQFASRIQAQAGREFPLTHVDDPFAIDFYLGTMRPLYFGPTRWTTGYTEPGRVATYDYEAAAELLKSDAAAYVVAGRDDELFKYIPRQGVHTLMAEATRTGAICIYSNRPSFSPEARMVMGVGPLRVDTDGLQWISAAQIDFVFAGHGSVTFHNGGRANTVRVRFDPSDALTTHVLQLDENWQVTH